MEIQRWHPEKVAVQSRSETILAKLRSFELIFKPARAAASLLISKRTLPPSTVKLIMPPFTANPSDSPTVNVLDPLNPRKMLSA